MRITARPEETKPADLVIVSYLVLTKTARLDSVVVRLDRQGSLKGINMLLRIAIFSSRPSSSYAVGGLIIVV
ncbi:MAG: hypothetical protein COW32_09560 [Candidatus Aquicultor secundus]|uniref:Uncharacterized protein n=1 Tax=Candidatus Aquicultor secundus TaxID=1973895 RepID=A0A2M7T774_9ACTN|nr:hypothetical protein [Candidatus Aquicultor secundus]NCO66388.1 hypothetical protein [Solirubrobacter sp.]OIO84304.1 MAG: hypothetical protein AUK32_08830 [Candidatus Aquicultor secundus]PIU27018.1 MAG: hypothetical protein COT10_05660 [Candidatus Aquicultor secundus]PIW21513.1 MAG: hypothetical protein COW32_09560 [Candidatus Aquicultor secundus]PIX52291.1 MAG: hypothetical protein COZ51_05020 [Candidatus Aquicultor secundus]